MPRTLETRFVGDKSSLFTLAIRLSILTVATLGFYRFWMKTRLRRWYWSAIRPGGHPLEYTGNGMEKLLGFLLAVVFLAFYIGVVNLILMFASFSVFSGATPAYALSFLGVIPLVFYARYRARRYILARTRWRGVRFGLEAGAWRYAGRAVLYWLAALLTLGVLWPLLTFRLEEFRTNRTWFGTARLHQSGTWKALMLPWMPCIISVWVSAGIIAYAAVTDDLASMLALLFTVPLAVFFYLRFTVRAFCYLTSNKHLGPVVRLDAAPRTGRVVRIHLLGNLMVGLTLGFFILGIGAALSVLFTLNAMSLGTLAMGLPTWIAAGAGLIGYFSFFVLWDVLRQVFVRLPLLAHFAETLKVENAHALADMDQRDRDEMHHAEGFAEALDVGAAL